jgi:hypothetical protein
MQNLGDLFPDNMKETWVEDNFKVGTVLKYHVDFTNPPKSKRLIVIGFDNSSVVFATVLINTEINPRLFPTKDLRDLHIELEEKTRDYLNHNSYVDCSQIHEQDINEVKKLILEDTKIHLGRLSEEDLTTITEKIKTAKTISSKTKKKFGLI